MADKFRNRTLRPDLIFRDDETKGVVTLSSPNARHSLISESEVTVDNYSQQDDTALHGDADDLVTVAYTGTCRLTLFQTKSE